MARRVLPPGHLTLVTLLFIAVFIAYIDRTTMSVAALAMQEEFGWHETEKGRVLSSFFVGYMLLMLAGGALANRYGGKIVLGLAVVWWSFATILTPAAAMFSLPALVAMRIALGLGEAAVFPASLNMIGRYVPASQRSRAVALLSSAIPLSTVIALPLTGWLIRSNWAVPFYLFGGLGLVWAALWFMPSAGGSQISPRSEQTRAAIPWRVILTLPCMWAIIISHFCFNWTLYVLLAWLPSYLKVTFNVTVMSASMLSAAPWVVSFLTGNLAGYLADRWLRAGRSATLVRKVMQSIGLGAGGVMLLVLPAAPSAPAAMLIISCAAGLLAFCYAGFPPNCFDIAPRHAEVLYAISNTVATLPGIVGVFFTGWLVDRTGSFSLPIVLTGGIAIAGAAVYLRLGSGDLQVD